MIINPNVTLYLFFDSKLSRLRYGVETKLDNLIHRKLKYITVQELIDLAFLISELETTEKIYLELSQFFC